MTPLRIGIVCREWPAVPEPAGGLGTYFRNLAVGLEERGAEPVVITGPSAPGPNGYNGPSFPVIRLEEPGVSIARRASELVNGSAQSYRGALFHTYNRRRTALQRQLPRLIERHRIDAVVGPLWAGELAEVVTRSDRPVVLRISGCLRRTLLANGHEPDHRDLQIHMLEQRALSHAAAAYAPTQSCLRDVLSCMATPSIPMTVIPSGVDIQRFRPDAQRTAGRPCRFLFVGRLETQKGIERLAGLIPRLVERHPDVEFHLAGSDTPSAPGGKSWRKYLQTAMPASAYHRCRFLGRVDWNEIPAVYRSCDVLLVPSISDSLPNTALEAMASGLAVVASAGAGLDDVIESGANGVIVSEDAPDAWLSEMSRMAADPTITLVMGGNARETVTAHFNTSATAHPVLALCRQAVGGRGSRRARGLQRVPAMVSGE